nr:translation initiation factor IF-2-like [Saimiri boliviensis boliviensis]
MNKERSDGPADRLTRLQGNEACPSPGKDGGAPRAGSERNPRPRLHGLPSRPPAREPDTPSPRENTRSQGAAGARGPRTLGLGAPGSCDKLRRTKAASRPHAGLEEKRLAPPGGRGLESRKNASHAQRRANGRCHPPMGGPSLRPRDPSEGRRRPSLRQIRVVPRPLWSPRR